jgi:hypothetical protein
MMFAFFPLFPSPGAFWLREWGSDGASPDWKEGSQQCHETDPNSALAATQRASFGACARAERVRLNAFAAELEVACDLIIRLKC